MVPVPSALVQRGGPVSLVLLVLVCVLVARCVHAAPEPAALATRADFRPAPDAVPLPPHLDRANRSQQPLREALRGVRWNAPGPPDPPDDAQRYAEEAPGFQLSPLVLAVTVDGQVHALKRETGQWVWTLHDDGGIAAGGTGRGPDRKHRHGAQDAIGGPLVRSASRRKRPPPSASAANGRTNETGVVLAEGEIENDETYIIEPAGNGDIYVYSRSTGALDKLPMSVQQLVAESPFRFSGDSSRLFSGSKNTRFVGVDLKTGRLVGVFGSNAGWCEWDEGDELIAGARSVDQDFEEDIDRRPEDLLYMARTEYQLSIYDSTSSAPLQTLSYTTYTSSALPPNPATDGYPTQSTWTRTPDSLYLQPMHDGALVCFRAGQTNFQWTIDFEAPVVSVFDVVVPLPSDSTSSNAPPGSPLMLEQPHPLLVNDLPLDFSVLQREPESTFVGRIRTPQSGRGGDKVGEGELFAMSRDRFPLVPFAQVAKAAAVVTGADEEGSEPSSEDGSAAGGAQPPPTCSGIECIIGRHRVRNPAPVRPAPGLDAASPSPSEPLLLDGPSSLDALPSASSRPELPGPETGAAAQPHNSTPNRRSPHQPGSSTLLASLYRSRVVRPLLGGVDGEPASSGSRLTAGVVLLVLAAWAWGKVRKSAGGASPQEGKVRVGAREGRRRGKKGRRAAGAAGTDEDDAGTGASTPSAPLDFAIARGAASANAAAPKASSTTGREGLRRRSPSTPPTPTSGTFAALSATPGTASRARARASSLSLGPAFPGSATTKDLPPLPSNEQHDDDDEGSPDLDSSSPDAPASLAASPSSASLTPATSLDDGADSDSGLGLSLTGGAPGTPPRKRNRRRRGAKKKKAKDGALVMGLGLDELGSPGEEALEGITLSARETRDEELDGSTGALVSAQVDAVGVGVDGEAAGASAPSSAATGNAPEEAVAKSAKLDPQTVGGLSVSETILGYGSHGTVVLRGEFQGRAVAVKRLLKDFVTIAAHEVNLLQESDDHPHVIRYFCKEQRETFLYIALELCPASLFDLVDQPSAFPDLVTQLDPKKALRQITSGLRHLHTLKIVHRDIKPQNILVSTAKRGQPGLRMLISDFGLCKKLDVDESSFQQTVNHAAGSFGYRAPEVLRGLVDPNEGATSGAITPSASIGSGGSSTTLAGLTTTDPSMRLTRSIDIFSLGCIFYYVLTRGEHPFGGRYEREMNILNGKVCLDRLDGLGEEAVEVQDLIMRMVATDPRERPAADAVLLHPFFWNAQKRLLFICDASDRFEIMERDPPAPTLISLERKAHEIVGDDWQKALDRTFLDNLGKYRKYDGASVRDLLRVLRNKKHHYQDLPETVRRALGDLPGGFLSYFTSRFPHLLLHVYDTVATHLSDEAMFASTFRIPEDEA
ncbi:hypothetical protein Rhopal_005647-T1 [Rhodotorula paludigena]|uniref:non-specific serine/threonine protein kinase n=1 Tax=Rhodotorula paludigena TaxID=86838 RepID=A0AAV5GSX4_9BASI|nr:hypothetical protein Rhopal_005647-T1 [Rhodotorula paludigena]